MRKIIVLVGMLLLVVLGACSTSKSNDPPVMPPVANGAGVGSMINERHAGETWTAQGVDYAVTWSTKPSTEAGAVQGYGVKGELYTEISIAVNNHGAQAVTNPASRLGISAAVDGQDLRAYLYARSTGADVLPGNAGVFTTSYVEAHGKMQIALLTPGFAEQCYWTGTI